MTEASVSPGLSPAHAAQAVTADAAAAGAMLRQLREAQGMHIAALATAIKVTPAKLDALEAGRLGELPDLTFARALAQTVCRALKADAAPVLARMPGAVASRLERVDEGLNTPMPERGHGLAWGAWSTWSAWSEWAPWRRPVPWLAALLLLAAAAFVLVPRQLAEPLGATLPGGDAASPAPAVLPGAVPPGAVPPAAAQTAAVPAEPVQAAAPLAAPLAEPVPAASAAVSAAVPAAESPATAVAALPGAAAASGVLQMRAVQNTWVQVQDAQGRVLVARTFSAGESMAFDGPAPLKLRIGNVAGTELVFQGRPVDLSKFRRDNVASLSLP
ncbi:helix-turn-helix domain-containing protein [Aquabacterium sp. OR-4]|uniref:helix-turn-helix domain-containing protein n=1 Tax=Aquabacterium sp. OR-4 TaxID=2978127 RepID=UPI0021B40426|nr:helix-turn-helix domain-containing protein [Aquabacterium sp. OR-4]MDT7835480.1 helix-turn-helix domain-containing protein [Aquabacterium sp. OR-4]